MGQTDGQTDARRHIDPAPHTMRPVSVSFLVVALLLTRRISFFWGGVSGAGSFVHVRLSYIDNSTRICCEACLFRYILKC